MAKKRYSSLPDSSRLDRRDFVKTVGACSVAAGGLVLAGPTFGAEQTPPVQVETNIADFMKVRRGQFSVPGAFPGKVVKVTDPKSLVDEAFDGNVIAEMVRKGITSLTGKNLKDSFRLFFTPRDVVGIKVNPCGPPLIHTKPEVVDAVVAWLAENGIPKSNIVIWDRFDYMLADAGYTPARFPGVQLVGLQTMDEKGSNWRDKDGNHLSINNFDRDVYYHAKGATWQSDRNQKDEQSYLNQHVFNGDYSYYGKLVTQKLTKIINIAAFKNTGQAISMATKNIAYGSICNTGRLHASLALKVNTEVIAAPVVRNKLVLNMIDALRAQYEGGPDKNAQFVYPGHTLYFATDPFALDMIGHQDIVAKRKAMGITVNENPRFTDYLRYAETLGLGVATPDKITVVKA
jgi:hypothetical protein